MNNTEYSALTSKQVRDENKSLKPSKQRICPRCREKQPLRRFNKEKGRCKECIRAAARQWAAEHRAYYLDNARRYRARMSAGRPLYFKYAHARIRAKRRGIEFSISYDDFTPMPDVCPVLGIPLNYDRRGKVFDDSPSLDRTDNRRGYVPGNVAVISWRANRLKMNATAAELERIAAWMRSRGAE